MENQPESLRIEMLNAYHGDKKIEVDTSTPEGRKAAAEAFNGLLRAGTAIFLERADKTYRVTGYDPETDKLTVSLEGRALAPVADGRSCACRKCDGCQNAIGANNRSGVCTPCQQSRCGGKRRPRAVRASHGPRKGRLTGVAPVAGG